MIYFWWTEVVRKMAATSPNRMSTKWFTALTSKNSDLGCHRNTKVCPKSYRNLDTNIKAKVIEINWFKYSWIPNKNTILCFFLYQGVERQQSREKTPGNTTDDETKFSGYNNRNTEIPSKAFQKLQRMTSNSDVIDTTSIRPKTIGMTLTLVRPDLVSILVGIELLWLVVFANPEFWLVGLNREFCQSTTASGQLQWSFNQISGSHKPVKIIQNVTIDDRLRFRRRSVSIIDLLIDRLIDL